MSGRQLDWQTRRHVYLGKQKEVLGFSANAAMDLPSTSYVSQSAKLPFSWSNSGELVPGQVVRNREERPSHSSRSPEIKSDDMDSVYSDAGDTFASRPCNGYENHEGGASPGGVRRTDVNARDFILRRFLPAAQAMATEGSSSATSTSTLSSDQRHLRDSEVLSSGRAVPMLPLPSKSRFAQEIKQDVQYDSGDEVDEMRACGFPLRLGRLTLRHLRHSFGTSRSSSRSKSPRRTKTVAQNNVQDEGSVDSEDLFWSDEEYFDNEESTITRADLISNLEGFSELKTAIQSDTVRIVEVNKGATTEGFVQVRTLPARLHSMQTVHTPDHKGFLGLPKTSGLSGESERARQVDRLGARLAHMISKANYIDPRSVRVNEHDEIEGSSQGPSATSSSSLEFPKAKWVDKVSAMGALMPPPSPKSPTESWLCNTLPPSRFVTSGARKSSRMPLGSYIPIKPPVKASSQLSCEDDLNLGLQEVPSRQGASLRQTCSLKEHMQGRQVFSSTAQAV